MEDGRKLYLPCRFFHGQIIDFRHSEQAYDVDNGACCFKVWGETVNFHPQSTMMMAPTYVLAHELYRCLDARDKRLGTAWSCT